MRIKEVIKQKGLTQKEVAEKLGMSLSGLVQIMTGKPSLTTLEKIAAALDVEVWELLVSREEVAGTPATEGRGTVCPYCGKSLSISVEATDDQDEKEA